MIQDELEGRQWIHKLLSKNIKYSDWLTIGKRTKKKKKNDGGLNPTGIMGHGTDRIKKLGK